ncbi:MAG TPA: hypothetical protein VGO50_19450 [Pyrinomonadaceae bacterium]|jgi:hypothetical protein|nr:hypothetical protein [Pyrinomonadaceae bacterium]
MAKTKTKEKTDNIPLKYSDPLVAGPTDAEPNQLKVASKTDSEINKDDKDDFNQKYEEMRNNVSKKASQLFELWESEIPEADFEEAVPIDSLESSVGYSSLFRQLHHAYVERVAYYRSRGGGALSIEEARERAFHPCKDTEEAKKELNMMLNLPLESLSFVDLLKLHQFAPRVAERFWENVKQEGRLEFESGHLAANITFPVEYMKDLWNIARYLGVRESFIEQWQPAGGIEISLIDMLTQAYFQWQFWLKQTVKRSQTREREEDYRYTEWKNHQRAVNKVQGWADGYWLRPYVCEQEAIEHAVQMADRWNRIFMRTLRQLRDLRRYAPVTINNPNQVNIASEGGQQVNVTTVDER